MQFKTVNINDLTGADYNPRKDLQPEDIEYQKIKRSIEEFGYVEPVIINDDHTIIGGHQRVKVLKDLGYEELQVIQISVDKTKEKALNVALNKITGEWDFDKLSQVLEDLDLEEFDLEITGFDLDEIDDLLGIEPEVVEDNYEVILPEEPKAKHGEIYQLGEHRLMCGDSTVEEEVDALMDEGIADMVMTDPPYNVDYGSKAEAINKYGYNFTDRHIKNDYMPALQFVEFLDDAMRNMEKHLKAGGAFYIWHASVTVHEFETALRYNNLKTRQQLVWNKNSIVLSRQDYHWKHEPCLYGWKEGKAHYFVDDRTQSTVIEDTRPKYKQMKKAELVALLDEIYSDKESTTVISEDNPVVSDMHPTMKPIKLLARLIKNSSKKNWNVLDLFGGSGSTLIACEQLERKCYMMELDPKYVDVIIDRWEQFTGQEAVRIKEADQ